MHTLLVTFYGKLFTSIFYVALLFVVGMIVSRIFFPDWFVYCTNDTQTWFRNISTYGMIGQIIMILMGIISSFYLGFGLVVFLSSYRQKTPQKEMLYKQNIRRGLLCLGTVLVLYNILSTIVSLGSYCVTGLELNLPSLL